jgi:hypothetical protein
MRKVSLVLVFLVAGVVGFAATLHALPCLAGCVFYYSDNTYAVQVGYKCWQCTGTPQISGTQTQHSLVDNPFTGCCGGHSGEELLCDYSYNPITHEECLVCY